MQGPTGQNPTWRTSANGTAAAADSATAGDRPSAFSGDWSVDGFDEADPDAEDILDDPDAGAATRRNLIEWGVVLVGAFLLALVLRALVLQAFWIPSPSMETTLLIRDRVLVNKVSYRIGDIGRGDIVVFRRTDAEIEQNPELPRDVIKRVIALGGETIEIIDNQVFIDGLLLDEPYLDLGVVTSDFEATTVPEGHVFVMGDNRELSLDSRFETGPIAEDRVVGRAFFLFWPLNRIGSL
ncbi:MAG: signal peptidase I [Actinomycetota bacterium]